MLFLWSRNCSENAGFNLNLTLTRRLFEPQSLRSAFVKTQSQWAQAVLCAARYQWEDFPCNYLGMKKKWEGGLWSLLLWLHRLLGWTLDEDTSLGHGLLLFMTLLLHSESTVQADCWVASVFLSLPFFTYVRTVALVGTSRVLLARLLPSDGPVDTLPHQTLPPS